MPKLTPKEIRQHNGVSFPGITVVFLCHDGDGNLFLAKRSNKTRDEHGRWDPGGGGVEHGQSIEENLLREVKEEYDATPLRTDFLGYFDAFRTSPEGHDTHWLALCFAVHLDPKEVRINEPDKVDAHGWFPLDDLPSPMHSQFEKFMGLHGKTLREKMLATTKRSNQKKPQPRK